MSDKVIDINKYRKTKTWEVIFRSENLRIYASKSSAEIRVCQTTDDKRVTSTTLSAVDSVSFLTMLEQFFSQK